MTWNRPGEAATEIFVVSSSDPDAKSPAWSALRNSMRENALLAGEAQFPEPGRANRPPDLTARYESYLAAIAHESFTPEQRAALRADLEAAFQNVIGAVAGQVD